MSVEQGDARAMADPAQIDAELAVLGACLLNKNAIKAVIEAGLRPEHLSSWRHRSIFAGVLALHHAGKSVDPIVLNDQLDEHGALDDVGGRAYVHTLMATPFVCQRARQYVGIILRRHRERARVRIGEALSAGELDESEATRKLAQLGGGENE